MGKQSIIQSNFNVMLFQRPHILIKWNINLLILPVKKFTLNVLSMFFFLPKFFGSSVMEQLMKGSLMVITLVMVFIYPMPDINKYIQYSRFLKRLCLTSKENYNDKHIFKQVVVPTVVCLNEIGDGSILASYQRVQGRRLTLPSRLTCQLGVLCQWQGPCSK